LIGQTYENDKTKPVVQKRPHFSFHTYKEDNFSELSTMASQTPFGSVLVTGGCGFIGHHIVSKLLDSEPTCQLSVLDADVDRNQFPGVAYYKCDISSKDQVQHALQKVKPQVIFHTECPTSSPDIPSLFEKIIVLRSRPSHRHRPGVRVSFKLISHS
jgi:hypothetical protein